MLKAVLLIVLILSYSSSKELIIDDINKKKRNPEIALIQFKDKKALLEKHKDYFGSVYLYTLNKKKWKKNKDDEFAMRELKSAYYKKFIKDIDSATKRYLNKNLTYYTYGSFGKYNFEKEVFPVKVETRKSSNKKVVNVGGWQNYGNPLYGSAYMVFNKSVYDIQLPMKKLDAKKFLESKKGKRGKISRQLKSIIEGKIINVDYCKKGNYKSDEAYYKGSTDRFTISKYDSSPGISSAICIYLDVESINFTNLPKGHKRR